MAFAVPMAAPGGASPTGAPTPPAPPPPGAGPPPAGLASALSSVAPPANPQTPRVRTDFEREHAQTVLKALHFLNKAKDEEPDPTMGGVLGLFTSALEMILRNANGQTVLTYVQQAVPPPSGGGAPPMPAAPGQGGLPAPPPGPGGVPVPGPLPMPGGPMPAGVGAGMP